jgi:formate dehydrogenase major subunit
MKTISLTIDTEAVCIPAGATLLDAARQAGITIPTLCHLPEDTSGACGNCGICAVSCEGKEKLLSACCTPAEEGMVIHTETQAVQEHRQQRLAALAEQHFGDCKAPCNLTCPGQINVQGYIGHVAKGQYEEAVRLVMEKNPFPFSVGRVCRRFCESRCRRMLVDEAIAINHLKRFTADWCMKHQVDLGIPRQPATGKQLAVVGGGPAGLTAAYYLAKNGHEVHLYEAEDKLGGLLRYGIPAYKVPKEVLDYEINTILNVGGIHVHTGTVLGKNLRLDTLKERFDAVLLTVGAGVDQPLSIPGSELPGVLSGLTFLRQCNTGQVKLHGKRAAVLGGSNIALESARSLLRLGYEQVTVINAKTDKEGLSATPSTLREAEAEQVDFLFMAEPVALRTHQDGGLEIELSRLKLGAADKRGRQQLEPVAGANCLLRVDTVIYALGQVATAPDTALSLSPNQLIQQDSRTSLSSVDKVYVAGEAVSGSKALIQVISSARKAAENIHAQLMGLGKAPAEQRFNFTRGKAFANVQLNTFAGIQVQMREAMPERPFQQARCDQEQVRLGYDEAAAQREAQRCLSCGCMAFDHCDFKTRCIENGVDPNKTGMATEALYAKDNAHALLEVDLNKCIYCRRCANACEYDALDLRCNSFDEQGRAQGLSLYFKEHCVHCGNCADHCSTGTLRKKDLLVPVVEEEVRRVRTTCPYCGAGCQMQLKVKGNTILEVHSEPDLAPNYGALCVKGRFAFDFVHSRERLTSPLIRRDGKLVEATWDEAYNFIATKLKDIKDQHGPDAVAGFSCARATNEENFFMQKFMRTVIGTNNIDHCARL